MTPLLAEFVACLAASEAYPVNRLHDQHYIVTGNSTVTWTARVTAPVSRSQWAAIGRYGVVWFDGRLLFAFRFRHRMFGCRGAPKGFSSGAGSPWDLKMLDARVSYVKLRDFHLGSMCSKTFGYVCGSTEKACIMVVSLRKVDISHPTGHYI